MTAVDDSGPGDAARRVLRAAGPVRLRQDHDAAHDRRLRGPDRRPRLPRRRGRHGAPAVQARRQHRLPVLRALPAPERREERRVRARAAARSPRTRSARARTRRSSSCSSATSAKRKPAPAVRRPAAARRARPRARQPAARAAPRRAARRARPAPAQAAADRAQAHPAGRRHHVRARHARPGRGDVDGRHDRRHERAARSSRPARPPTSTSARAPSSWRTSSGSPTSSTASSAAPRAASPTSRPTTAPASTCPPTASARTTPTRSASACGRRRSRCVPVGEPCRDGDSNSLRGTVVVAAFLGTSIQYVIQAPGGEELTVFAQNLDGSEPDSFGPGPRGRSHLEPPPHLRRRQGAERVSSNDPRIERALEEFFESERLSRRGFIGRAGSSGLALSGLAAVLAACGGVQGEAEKAVQGQAGRRARQPPEDHDRRLDVRQLAALHRQEGPQARSTSSTAGTSSTPRRSTTTSSSTARSASSCRPSSRSAATS